jgi:hypothetical protein
MSILSDIWQTHAGGVITAAGIVLTFAAIGWASDARRRRENRKTNKEKE